MGLTSLLVVVRFNDDDGGGPRSEVSFEGWG